MVDGSIQEKKIRSALGHRKGSSIDQQTHSHVGGMPFEFINVAEVIGTLVNRFFSRATSLCPHYGVFVLP
jgi:hypothetical protein